MPEASNTISIARRPADVFSFLSNAENDPQWRGGILEISRTGGDGGVGTTYRQVVAGPGGRHIDADVEITEVVPNQRIAFRATKGPVRPVGDYQLTERGGSTDVTFSLSVELSGFKKLMAPMVRRTMKSEVGALEKLKTVLEKAS